MKKLSVLVDLRSIAWIISENNKIIDKGIKRVNVDFDNYYEYISGLPVSKRINRRLKRSARRNNYRRISRRDNLINYLEKKGYLPINDELEKYSSDEMLNLRIKALSEKLQPYELGTIFLNLNKNRGYKSMRGVIDNASRQTSINLQVF